MLDFSGETSSEDLNDNSVKMGVVAADIREIIPAFAASGLKRAFTEWKENVPLFVSSHAILLGAETRNPPPVHIKRNENYESEDVTNIYPIGKSSGYTGGITSPASDAIKAVEKCVPSL